MRLVAGAVVLLAACGSSKQPPERELPAVLIARGPGSADPECPLPQDDGSLGQPKGCRVDGVTDLDGDHVDDCWRREYPTEMWVWRSCTGEPFLVKGEEASDRTDLRGDIHVLKLPFTHTSPAWVESIAKLLAGRRAGCDKPSAGCPAPGPIGRWLLDVATPDHDDQRRMDFHSPWNVGTKPSPPAPEVIAIADDRREQSFDRPGGNLVGSQLIVVSPQPDDAFHEVATCAGWSVWSNNSFVAAVDTKLGRWRWILARGDKGQNGETSCKDGMVFVRSSRGTDIETQIIIDAVDGHIRETLDPKDPALIAIGFTGDGSLGTCEGCWMPLAQMRVAMRPPPATPCTRPAGPEPIASLGLGDRCTVTGKEDIDGDGTPECWKIVHRGDPTVGTILWDLVVSKACGDKEDSVRISGDVLLPSVSWGTPAWQRWLGTRLFGSVSCLPATATCPAPDRAMTYMIVRSQQTRDVAKIPLRWWPGVPTAPSASATVVSDAVVNFEKRASTLVVYNAALGGANRPPPAKTGSCGDLEVWTGGGGVALRDPKQDRFAWVFREGSVLVDDGRYAPGAPMWPHTIGPVSCEGDYVLIALDGYGPANAFVDRKTGATGIMSRKDWAQLPAGPERPALLRRYLSP